MKELWCYTDNRISVRFEYEWRDAATGHWMRTHGNEHWEFDDEGLMRRRDMSANDYPIEESERRYQDRSCSTPEGIIARTGIKHVWSHQAWSRFRVT